MKQKRLNITDVCNVTRHIGIEVSTAKSKGTKHLSPSLFEYGMTKGRRRVNSRFEKNFSEKDYILAKSKGLNSVDIKEAFDFEDEVVYSGVKIQSFYQNRLKRRNRAAKVIQAIIRDFQKVKRTAILNEKASILAQHIKRGQKRKKKYEIEKKMQDSAIVIEKQFKRVLLKKKKRKQAAVRDIKSILARLTFPMSLGKLRKFAIVCRLVKSQEFLENNWNRLYTNHQGLMKAGFRIHALLFGNYVRAQVLRYRERRLELEQKRLKDESNIVAELQCKREKEVINLLKNNVRWKNYLKKRAIGAFFSKKLILDSYDKEVHRFLSINSSLVSPQSIHKRLLSEIIYKTAVFTKRRVKRSIIEEEKFLTAKMAKDAFRVRFPHDEWVHAYMSAYIKQ